MVMLVRHRSTAEGEEGTLYEHIGEIFDEEKRGGLWR
jgi:hypothetical protein